MERAFGPNSRFPAGMTTRKAKARAVKQVLCEDDNQKGNGKSNDQYRGLSTTAAKAPPPVEMTEAG